MVCGSELYTVRIAIAPVTTKRWRAICKDCAGGIESLVELLQGRLSKGVMDRVCREGDGLFPAPEEIELSCTCPDWAEMCKHLAAVLYGIGARLDSSPELLFKLRGVDESELLANADRHIPVKTPAPAVARVLDDGQVAALFGLEMSEEPSSNNSTGAERQRTKASKRPNGPAGTKVTTSKKGVGGARGSTRQDHQAYSITEEQEASKGHLMPIKTPMAAVPDPAGACER